MEGAASAAPFPFWWGDKRESYWSADYNFV